MTIDSKWTWTILMAKGKIYHAESACSLEDLLDAFKRAGFHFAEIEAIIRH